MPEVSKMTSHARTVDEYIERLPEERRGPFTELRNTIISRLPPGFEETIAWNMPSWVVPLPLYPAGYHCDPKSPLPFLSIASQKHFFGVYHMGLYSSPELLKWFQTEYALLDIGKPDMGKSCIRLRKIDRIPYRLIGDLASKMSVDDWIHLYEREIRR
jgi:hypothetical protein